MAAITGRERMINSIEEVTGRDDCSEVILAQERPAWTPWAIMLVAVVAGFLMGAFTNTGTVVTGIVVGVVVGIGFVMSTEYWVLARCGDEVLLARSSKLSAKAVEVVDQWPAPVAAEQKKGLMQSRMTLDGRTLMIARQFVQRAEAIVR